MQFFLTASTRNVEDERSLNFYLIKTSLEAPFIAQIFGGKVRAGVESMVCSGSGPKVGSMYKLFYCSSGSYILTISYSAITPKNLCFDENLPQGCWWSPPPAVQSFDPSRRLQRVRNKSDFGQ